MPNVQPKLSPRQELDRRRAEAAAVAASTRIAIAAGLEVKPCHLCSAPVVWCRTKGKSARGPAAVQIVAEGVGRVVIERDMIDGALAPVALEQGSATRYAWHRERCGGSFSHVGAARPRKVRP